MRLVAALLFVLAPVLATAQEPTSEAKYTYAALAAGSVSGTHAQLLAAPGTGSKYVIIDIFNGTDGDIIISFNGGTTDHAYLKAGTGKIYDLRANSLHETGAIYVKDEDATTTGSVYGTGVK